MEIPPRASTARTLPHCRMFVSLPCMYRAWLRHSISRTTLKQPCSLPPPLRCRTLSRPMVCAQVRSHQPSEQNGLSRGGYGGLWRTRPAPTGQSLCESYFGTTRADGGGVHTPHAHERWPAIVSGSWRERPHHITPEITAGCDPPSVPRCKWRC